MILHDRRAVEHYLNNVVFEFEVDPERLDGNFDKSSIERCLTPKAVNALEIHCQAVKVPLSAAAALLFGQEMPESEPVFSVGLDDLAFKMSSCRLASSTDQMMRVKRRRRLTQLRTPEKPCSIVSLFSGQFNGEKTLEYNSDT